MSKVGRFSTLIPLVLIQALITFLIAVVISFVSSLSSARTKILNQMSKKHVKFMLSKVPRGRLLEVEEMSSLVCWLSSKENSFSTAAVFDISGGRSTY